MKTINSGPITTFKELSRALFFSTDVDRISLNRRNRINPSTATYPNLGIPGVFTIDTALDIILTSISTPFYTFPYENVEKSHNYQNGDIFQY